MISKSIDISVIIKDRIRCFDLKIDYFEIGYIVIIGDGIVLVNGFDNVKNGEIVKFKNNIIGLVLNLEEEVVGVVIFGDVNMFSEGDLCIRIGEVIVVFVGDELIGRVINVIGNLIDGKGLINSIKRREIFKVVFGVMSRVEVNELLEIGIIVIDLMILIGKG